MNQTKIWLSSPHMGGSEMKFVQEAFDTNWVAPLGANVNGFEVDLESFLGENVHVAALSTGTAAMHLAMVLMDVKAGDEVICQSMTFSASANPIVYQGATPIFVDSEPDTWNICPNALEAAIKDRLAKGKKPKAIVTVHLYGMPYKHAEIKELSDRYDIPIIEDAAEAIGSQYKGRACGTFGDLAILSFNGNKIITTSGGGALVCKTKKDKDQAVFLATQARDLAPHYQHSHIGYNYRLSNICAGIGRGQMEVLPNRVKARRSNQQFYTQLFDAIDGIDVHKEFNDDYFSNHWLSAIILQPSKLNYQREDLRMYFLENQIETRPLWKPLHLQPIFKDAPYYGGQIAENLFDHGLCLPSGSNLSDADKEHIKKVMLNFKN